MENTKITSNGFVYDLGNVWPDCWPRRTTGHKEHDGADTANIGR